VPVKDMRSTFNLGIGLIFIVENKSIDKLSELIKKQGFTSTITGEIIADI
jgi:phosphoribosylaminoimidazole (AIR) synthetase